MHNPERLQIFIADDAFGSTEYDPTRSNLWAINLAKILRKLDRKHWLIWTARKHILEIALQKMRLQGRAENFPDPGAILVDAGNLTKTEKALILYRHAKAAGLEEDARKLIKGYAEVIVLDRHFTPERIRRFVSTSLSTIINEYKAGTLKKEALSNIIKKEIKEPTKALKQAFDCLPKEHKRLMISRLDIPKRGWFTDVNEFVVSYQRFHPLDTTATYEQIENDLALSFLKPIKAKESRSYVLYGEG